MPEEPEEFDETTDAEPGENAELVEEAPEELAPDTQTPAHFRIIVGAVIGLGEGDARTHGQQGTQ